MVNNISINSLHTARFSSLLKLQYSLVTEIQEEGAELIQKTEDAVQEAKDKVIEKGKDLIEDVKNNFSKEEKSNETDNNPA